MKTEYVVSPIHRTSYSQARFMQAEAWPHLSWKTLGITAIFLSVVFALSASQPIHAEPPIPGLAIWQEDLLTFGERQCHYYREPGWEGGSGDPYYDGARVFYQAADYFGSPTYNGTPWVTCAQLAAVLYRSTQLEPPNTGGAAPWNNFSTGLRLHYERTGDTVSRAAVHGLATHGYASDGMGGGFPRDFAREIAYAIHNHIDDEALGQPHRPRLEELVNDQLHHFTEWFSGSSPPRPGPVGSGQETGVQSFMVGLAAEALIRYYERYPDPRIPTALYNGLPKLYQWNWRANQGGFVYDNPTDLVNIEPGLNLLIATAYAWAYRQTGNMQYLTWGDEIFYKGVCATRNASISPVVSPCTNNPNGGYLWFGKQFNQQYRWSFKYIALRQGSGGIIPVPAPPQNLNAQ